MPSTARPGTFTLTFNGQTAGYFSSVDALVAGTKSSASIDLETKKLSRMIDRRSTSSTRVNKVDAFSLKQKVAEGGINTVDANTPLVLHGFAAIDQDWDPSSLADNSKTGEIVLWDGEGNPVARYHFTNAWPSRVPPGGAPGDLALLVQGLRRLDS